VAWPLVKLNACRPTIKLPREDPLLRKGARSARARSPSPSPSPTLSLSLFLSLAWSSSTNLRRGFAARPFRRSHPPRISRGTPTPPHSLTHSPPPDPLDRHDRTPDPETRKRASVLRAVSLAHSRSSKIDDSRPAGSMTPDARCHRRESAAEWRSGSRSRLSPGRARPSARKRHN